MAAERLQKIARGESEANTPRNRELPRICAASAALENVTLHPVPLTRHISLLDSRSRGARGEAARTPRYLLMPLNAAVLLVQASIRQRDARALDRSDHARHVNVAGLHDHRHLARRRSGHGGAGHEDAGDVRLHRLGIVNRLTIVAAQFDAELFKER